MLYHDLLNKRSNLVVVGLGYVGLPLAVEFAKYVNVIGFDIDQDKIAQYKTGIDPTNEVGNEALLASTIQFTSNASDIVRGNFFIVCVPTPIKGNKEPDLSLIEASCKIVGPYLQKGSIVVFESTVYPGVTEDICVPLLERYSGLTIRKDFSVGYSPERINPSDKVHRVHNIIKVVSGLDEPTLDEVDLVYQLICKAGTFRVSNIKTAEATKLAENTQRDINIAFMNELAMFFDKTGISTKEVVDAMNTKWNALNFRPGLVGGHCIGVDPYYFIYESHLHNLTSAIVSASRKLNDELPNFIVDTMIKIMIQGGVRIKGSTVWVAGITFKENCPDIRNSKVVDIIHALQSYGVNVRVSDPYADAQEVYESYGLNLEVQEDIDKIDAILLAVAHDVYVDQMMEEWVHKYNRIIDQEPIFIDVKSVYDRRSANLLGLTYWSL
ncbi:MAG: nucleotide sugar dehydrogenase [Erysipelotrichaceae bacterium]